MKEKKRLTIFFVIGLFLICIGIYKGIRIYKSYSYISNTEDVRMIIKNVAGFYYDRKSYIQYDSTYMNRDNSVKRSQEFAWIDANRDTVKYTDEVGFINNVFKYGIGFDLKSEIGELTLEGLIQFGKKIYNEKEIDDKRLNVNFNDSEYMIDYYDNEVVRLSGSMMAITDYHYLIMYQKNNELTDIEKQGISKTLRDSLYEGDILVINNNILLYIGNGQFMYATGENYDYQNGVDKYEDRAINVIAMDELNDVNNEMYLFNSQEIFMFRFINKTGLWNKLPVSYKEFKNYYSQELVPNVMIEKYGSKGNNSDIYQDEIITIMIKITNNSDSEIIIPVIKDVINTNEMEYVSNSYINDAYMDGELTFTNIKVRRDDYIEISYQVKVKNSEGIIRFDKTTLGEYKLNEITYQVGKQMDMTRLINGQGDVFTNYKKLYGITVSEEIMDDSNSDITISNLYGGIAISGHSLRSRKINEDILITGDMILYDDEVVMYVNNNVDSYLVSRDNKRIDLSVQELLNSLFSKDKYQIIRPSYLYDEFVNKLGELVVDEEKKIIHVKKRCTYQDIIDYLKKNIMGDIVDNYGNMLEVTDGIMSGSKIVFEDGEYLISLLGDINGDGLINTGDVLKLHRYVLGKIEVMEDVYIYSSYLNSDNLINTGDVMKLHRYILGKIVSLER